MANMFAKLSKALNRTISEVETTLNKFIRDVNFIHDTEFYSKDDAWLPEIKSISVTLCTELKELHSELIGLLSELKSTDVKSDFSEPEYEDMLDALSEARDRSIRNIEYDLKDTADKVNKTLTYVIEDYIEGDLEKETLLKETIELYLGLVSELA